MKMSKHKNNDKQYMRKTGSYVLVKLFLKKHVFKL